MRRGAIIEAAALAAVLVALSPARADGLPSLRIEASTLSDSNVTRAGGTGDALPDRVLGLNVASRYVQPISARTRAVAQVSLGTEAFHTYTGLSRRFASAQIDFQFRAAGDFGSPTWSVFVKGGADRYQSTLRDGYRRSLGLSVLKPATDRIQLFGALALNVVDTKSSVFDTRSMSLRGSADWTLSARDVVYFGADFRRGDAVSTARPSLGLVDTAQAIVQDDAFTDTARYAYRFKASTTIASLGYNRAFSHGQSLDLSLRIVQSKALEPAATATSAEVHYAVRQFSLAYLVRF